MFTPCRSANSSVRANCYDLAMNGLELGSGSIRIHRKDIQQQIFASLGISAEGGLKCVLVEPPKPRAKGIMVKDVAELVDALKKKGLV